MILDFICNALTLVKTHRKFSTLILLVLNGLNMIPRPTNIQLMSQESLFAMLEKQDFTNNKLQEKIPQKPDSQTILIVTEDKELFENKVRRLEFYSKGIEVTREDKPGNYFLRIFVKNADNTCLLIDPLAFLPISEVYVIAKNLFSAKFIVEWPGFIVDDWTFRINTWKNALKLNLSYVDMNKFLMLLRYLNNFNSHYYGLYFYVPVGDKIIKGDTLGISILLVFFCCLLNHKRTETTPTKIMIQVIVYKCIPILSVVSLFRNEFIYLLPIYTVINIKYAYILATMKYLMIIWKTICSRK